MRFKTVTTGLAVAVLSTVLAPIAVSTPAVAQLQTSWYVNDNPRLFGPEDYWFWGDAGHGYGSNNYRYTYAIGGESSADNWARWEMGERVGRQEIQVYVPSNHATATVNYNIRIGSHTSKKAVAQGNVSGWYSLGDWTTDGSEVAVSVYDNDAQQHWERDGARSSWIGVDAIRMRCVSDCGAAPSPPSPPPPPPPPPPDNRQVVISLGDDNSGSGNCPYSQLPCRWVNVTLRDFPAGSYHTRCVWWHSESSTERVPISTTINHNGGASTTYTRLCSFNVSEGRSIWATIGGVKSNTLRFSGNPPTPPPPPPPPDNRQVVISLGDDNSGSGNCPYSQLPCRWVNVTLRDFPAGSYHTRCVWWHSESSTERVPISTTINHNGGASTTYTRLCSFNVSEGRSIWATIGGVKSNTLRFSGNPQTPPPPPPPLPEPDDEVTRPSSPRNLRLTLTDENSFRITWAPPSDNGGASITGYTLTVSRPRLSSTVGPWSETYSVKSSGFKINGRSGATYTVKVSAKNRVGTGPPATTRITTQPDTIQPDTIQPETCPAGGKYERRGGGWRNWWRSTHVYALRSFQTDDGKTVKPGDEGGIVSSGNHNLDQRGCSWVTINAKVVDTAHVSDNALITGRAAVEDDAKVKGNAQVSGNARVDDKATVYGSAKVSGNARVYGKAKVYGDASVSGEAKVYGKAEVYGNASVSGKAKVYGDAKVYGTAVLDSEIEVYLGDFDGIQEYERAAKSLYKAAYDALYAHLRNCLPPKAVTYESISRLVVVTLHPKAPTSGYVWIEARNLKATYEVACFRLISIRNLARANVPTTALDWAVIIVKETNPLVEGYAYFKTLRDVFSSAEYIDLKSKYHPCVAVKEHTESTHLTEICKKYMQGNFPLFP